MRLASVPIASAPGPTIVATPPPPIVALVTPAPAPIFAPATEPELVDDATQWYREKV